MVENKKNLKIVAILLMAIGLSLISYATFINFNNTDDNKEDKKEDKKEEIIRNEVEIDEFVFSFLKLESDNTNLVYSPLSIKYALSMLKEGANGTTKDEIVSLIGENLPNKYNNIKDVLSLANSLFVRDSYKDYIKEEYVNILKDKYDAEFFYDKFENAKNINDWISDKTFNIIQNLLDDIAVKNSDLKMVLINALAIDMDWVEKFDEASTHVRPFMKENGEEFDAAMMYKSTVSKYYKYYQDEEFNSVVLPLKSYDDTQLEFVAIMPRATSLNSFLTSDNLVEKVNDILDNLKTIDKEKEELSITIPRFEFDYNLNLKEDLQKLGINTAFNPTEADFSKMSNSELFVGDALHKANIKFSEKGIKAAAVTVILINENAAIKEPKDIKYLTFDKPFMFIVRDSKTKEIWFTGTVYEPLLWEDVKDDYKYE